MRATVTEPASAALPTSSPGVPTSSVGRAAGRPARGAPTPRTGHPSPPSRDTRLAWLSTRVMRVVGTAVQPSTRTAPAPRAPRRVARHAHRHHAAGDRERRAEGGPRRRLVGQRLAEPGDLRVVGTGILVRVDPERRHLPGVGEPADVDTRCAPEEPGRARIDLVGRRCSAARAAPNGLYWAVPSTPWPGVRSSRAARTASPWRSRRTRTRLHPAAGRCGCSPRGCRRPAGCRARRRPRRRTSSGT